MKQKLKKYINEKNVIALNGPFGVGKTTLLKQYIKENSCDKFILFNAWEFDFAENPKAAFLLSVYKSIYKELSNDGKLDELWKEGWKNILALLKNGLKHRGFSLEGNKANYEIDFKEYVSTKNLILNIKNNIKKICDKYEGNVILIIDDLDRARPDFSLEIFEIAKHIFDVQGLSIILVYNKETMNEVLKKKFGVIRGEKYLEKYIDRRIDFKEEGIYGMFLEPIGSSEGYIFSTFLQQLNIFLPISRRKIETVLKYNNCENVVGVINGNSRSRVTSIDSILWTIIVTFRWFVNDDPFERVVRNSQTNFIKIKEKYKWIIRDIFNNSWFGETRESPDWQKFSEIKKLINADDFIENQFLREERRVLMLLERNMI
ncbi:KAP family P-loop NTPase fold protein [Mycoplasma todarodis]|uniref:AAA+ ATPase domain-containing protein n=1 Tax=Mycoplasma todarodis TaxID=1937191 RepID=A0A4R0XW34_9MOLU|nr:P-loop NTPase fold protein [Mycoplasma todarodis]TCG12105.1 hypothetical protein C4B25_00220 [Mycoplasma todarodis]